MVQGMAAAFPVGLTLYLTLLIYCDNKICIQKQHCENNRDKPWRYF